MLTGFSIPFENVLSELTKTLSIDYSDQEEPVYCVQNIKDLSQFPLKNHPSSNDETIHEHTQVLN